LSKTFGNRLKDLREQRNLTQLEVSKHVDCSSKVLSNYELDKREPDFQTLVRISDYFGVTTDYLLGRTDVSISYKDISLDSKSESLLTLNQKLPEELQYDVIRYTKLNVLDTTLKNK
jgi:transcriptional regulator with XRE-family HTH domain